MEDLNTFLKEWLEIAKLRQNTIAGSIYKIERDGNKICPMKKKFFLDTLFLNNSLIELLSGNDKIN